MDAKRKQDVSVFVREDEQVRRQKAGRDGEERVDVGKQLRVPQEIAATDLRPDLVLWSETQCCLLWS